jgi:hypothetical protein
MPEATLEAQGFVAGVSFGIVVFQPEGLVEAEPLVEGDRAVEIRAIDVDMEQRSDRHGGSYEDGTN